MVRPRSVEANDPAVVRLDHVPKQIRGGRVTHGTDAAIAEYELWPTGTRRTPIPTSATATRLSPTRAGRKFREVNQPRVGIQPVPTSPGTPGPAQDHWFIPVIDSGCKRTRAHR